MKQSKEVLTPAGVKKMQQLGQKYVGKSYDLKFEWSDDKMYCSELVWKLYKEAFNIEIGKLQQIKDFDLTNPYCTSQNEGTIWRKYSFRRIGHYT